jgi:hypothetical protein
MQTIILEFNSNEEEINEYFRFVKTTTHLAQDFNVNQNIRVSKTVHNILKANLFLLLYNLIESSFADALEKICINITEENIKYKNVIPEIKKMWIQKRYKNFENIEIPKNTQKSEFIMNKISDIAEDIIKIEFYTDTEKKKNNDISGNVDAREINKINERYGAKLNNNPNIDTNAMLIVKNKRNVLTHGDESFSVCGANYTLNDLEAIKDDSLKYMKFILTHIEDFIKKQKYRLQEEN